MTLTPEQEAEIVTQRGAEMRPTRRATARRDPLRAAAGARPRLVRVIDYMGDDAAVVQAARVSYGRGTKRVSEDQDLINYLMPVYGWVRTEAARLPEPEMSGETAVLTLDEMGRFLKKRLGGSGFGERMTLCVGAPSPGRLVAVMMPPVKSSSPRSGSREKSS